MGAKDDTKEEEKEPLSKKELTRLTATGSFIAQAIAQLDDSGVDSRELSLVLVNLEQAEMWLDRSFEEMGYDLDDGPDDDDPDDDEPDEQDEEEKEEDTGT